MRNFSILMLCAFCLVSQTAQANPAGSMESQMAELTKMVQELKFTVEKQAQEITLLKTSLVQSQSAASAAPVSQVAPNRPLGNKIIPEIGVVADMALQLDSPKGDEEGADRLSVREIELVLGSYVDPYSRLDTTIAITEEEVELEEAYLTRFELPFDTTGRFGRFKPRIGKALAVHRDSLDTVDEPLVIQRYFGHHGMSKTGADFKKILDLPSPFVHEVTAGVLEGGNGEEGALFGESKRRPTIYSHLKNYIDFSDDTNLELGLSHAAGSRDEDSAFEVQVLAMDATWMHHFNANQNLKLQGEAFHVNREESFLDLEDADTGDISQQDIDGNILGAYLLADFRFHPQWGTGFRWDYVETIDNPIENPEKADIGYTAYLTFYQSEFARWRVQLSHFDLTSGNDDNQVLFQGTFAIGEHKHKIQ